MTDHRVTEQQGWNGIADALARAVPGDTVLVGTGRYTSCDTLRVGSGVTLAGEAGAVLAYTGENAAIKARGVRNVVVRALTVEGYDGLEDAPAEGEALEFSTVGLIEVDEVEQAVVEGCIVRSRAKRRGGVAVSRSKEVAVRNNKIEGAIRGLIFASASGLVEDNFCSDGMIGIALTRHPERINTQSVAAIRRNCCYNNESGGIGLFSSLSSAIEYNECYGNVNGGISLQRDASSPDAPSEASIRGNRCHKNGSGILLISSSSNGIEENECWENALAGITLQRDPKRPDARSAALIRGNHCRDSRESAGILLISSSSSGIEDNTCSGNANGGIVLQRGSESPDAQSEALIRGNRCYDNTGAAGIILFSSWSNGIDDNECSGNRGGIVLKRSLESPNAPSQALIRNNHCRDNAGGSGIALLSSFSSGIEDNECCGNGHGGIILQRRP